LPDGAVIIDGSVVLDGAVIGSYRDGSVVIDRRDAASFPDGSIPDGALPDGGDPLGQDRAAFCSGEGSVVIIGADNRCAGDVAEETFQFGVCTCESLDVQSSFTVDAFDSTAGAYGASLPGGGVNVLADGHLGANGSLITSGKVDVAGGAYVSGDFSVGASSTIDQLLYVDGSATQLNSSTSVGDDAYVSGNIDGRYHIAGDLYVPDDSTVDATTANRLAGTLVRQPVPSILPCPCGDGQVLDVASIVDFGRRRNDNDLEEAPLDPDLFTDGNGPSELRLPCGRWYLRGIRQQGSLTIVAEGRTVLYVDGDLAVDGSLTLALEDGAEFDVFVSGSLSVTAAARLGERSAPSRVRTYVGGGGDIAFTASSELGGNLYAPNSAVSFGASAAVFGALFARTAAFTGSAQVHFDRAIRSAGAACEEPEDPVEGGLDAGADASADPDGGVDPDAGIVDTGTDVGAADGASPDAGEPTGCTLCSDCTGGLGCVIESGASVGQCAPCQSDLDCCAPNRCLSGQCTLPL
jgi:hypothetical protein